MLIKADSIGTTVKQEKGFPEQQIIRIRNLDSSTKGLMKEIGQNGKMHCHHSFCQNKVFH